MGFLAGVIFVISAKDAACTSYYTQNRRFDYVCSSLLFCLLLTILDVLKYLVSYKFVHGMGKDPFLTSTAFNRCSKVDWERTAVRGGFVLNNLRTGNVFRLEEKSVPASRRIWVRDGAPSSILLPRCPCLCMILWGGLNWGPLGMITMSSCARLKVVERLTVEMMEIVWTSTRYRKRTCCEPGLEILEMEPKRRLWGRQR